MERRWGRWEGGGVSGGEGEEERVGKRGGKGKGKRRGNGVR